MKIIVDEMPSEPKECIFKNIQHVNYGKEEVVNLVDVIS